MKKILSILLLIFLNMPNILAYDEIYGDLKPLERQVLTLGNNTCKGEKFNEAFIPTIFIPGILASWYSEEGYANSKVKRWIPDPITHAYDTLFNTFYTNGYRLKDVFYKDEFNTYIEGNPQSSLYLFGYDWKKDNKITAKLLSNLILQIRKKYEEENGCDIGTVNIISHSMGGLVARAMLEDMCVKNNVMNEKSYYDRTGLKNGEIRKYESSNCFNFTKINKFVTISTPQRGSPNSFPMWEKGDILSTNPFIDSEFLKGQLGILTNDDLYKLIHGYNSQNTNGIITIGQLLPDLQNKNVYNDELSYLKQDNKKIITKNLPVNSFLEELNKEANIEKMFDNISGKYSLYYSTLTGNKEDLKLFTKNNIISYELNNKVYNTVGGLTSIDNTSKHVGGDIYSYFPEYSRSDIYNIKSKIINENGLGGDGTVPTHNLLLVSNDTGLKIKNTKFKDIKIQCYEDALFIDIEGFNLEKHENTLTKKLGDDTIMEMCSHTKMSILTSIQVYEKISGKILRYDEEGKISILKEQQLLYKYLGYTDYFNVYYNINRNSNKSDTDFGAGSLDNSSGDISYNTTTVGISNYNNLENYYNPVNYNRMFFNEKDVENFIKKQNNDKTERISLNFSGQLGTLDSLLRYEILSPINIIIEDELGRKIGIDPDTGMIINEIPGAWTSGDTEGSNEPEFFLIPKTGTGQVSHKIHTYGTGDGEYHIVMNEIKTDESMSGTEANLTIAGVAKKGEEEGYIVGIKGSKAGFTKVKVDDLNTSKETDLEEKYKDILEKLYSIIDGKYSQLAKDKLREKLVKFQLNKNSKFKDNEKVNYLIGKLVEYLK